MKPIESRLCRRLCLIYIGFVTILSLLPKGPRDEPLFFEGEDKVVHVGMYAILVLMSVLANREMAGRSRAMCSLMTVSAFAWGYSLAMEIAQALFYWLGRSCSVADLLANLLGVLLGAGLVFWLRSLRVGARWLLPPVGEDRAGSPDAVDVPGGSVP